LRKGPQQQFFGPKRMGYISQTVIAPSKKQQALARAISGLLRPIVRMLVRNSMPFATLEALAKRAYVEVAYEEFAIPGKRPTISRASVLSGLTRKDVQRLVNEREVDSDALPPLHNRASRVLTGWVRDPRYHGSNGKPRALDVEGVVSFGALVKRHSGDMPPGAILDELLRVGAIRRTAKGKIELVQRAYVPAAGEVEKLDMLGSDVADLIETIDHNVEHGGDDPRFQRKVMYHDIPASMIPAFRNRSAYQAQALLERLDRWLSKAAQNDKGAATTPRARIGMGIFYFEQHNAQADSTRGPS
jgi:Family of unknown function (DUF6502)